MLFFQDPPHDRNLPPENERLEPPSHEGFQMIFPFQMGDFQVPFAVTLPETNIISSHLKMDGWKTEDD